MPEIPPKKAIGNKTLDFIEERRFLLQEFLVSLSRHEYLWRSEEFTAWVRTSPAQDLVAALKEKIKLQIKMKPNVDGDLADRIDRYDHILSRIKQTADFDNQQLDTIQLLQLVEQTNRFATTNIPWLKNMAQVFKQLSDKNARFLSSQKGLQQDVEEYRSSVCVKNGSKSKPNDLSNVFLLPPDRNSDLQEFVMVDHPPTSAANAKTPQFSRSFELQERQLTNEETKIEIELEQEEIGRDEQNSVKNLCEWSAQEVMELQGVLTAIKYFKKLNTRID